MSENVAKTLPVGPVQPYWNDVRLGSPKGQATIRYTKESVRSTLEEAGKEVGSKKTKEIVEVDLVIADFKIAQLRYVYDQSTGFGTSSTIQTTNYEQSTAQTLRFREEVRLSGTANGAVTLAESGFVAGTIDVFKSDLSEEFTQVTDYSASGSVIWRIATGSISEGDTVVVEYNNSATCDTIHVGGSLADFEAPMRLVHYPEDGKPIQCYIHRAKKIGASDVAIQMATEFGGVPMTFVCLADMSQPLGKQLFRWDKRA